MNYLFLNKAVLKTDYINITALIVKLKIRKFIIIFKESLYRTGFDSVLKITFSI